MRWGLFSGSNQLRYSLSLLARAKVVVLFSAAWSEPGKMIEPIFKDLSCSNTDAEFAKVDVDELSVRTLLYFVPTCSG
jgi:thiol-disulfide isomerase/thioredoxin